MKLPAAFFLFGIILVALSAFADENSATLASDDEATPQNPSETIYRKPGIMENWEATANIFSLDDAGNTTTTEETEEHGS